MKYVFLSVILLVFTMVSAQDSIYTRSVIQKLCSQQFHGRGYVNNGDYKAASFIANSFKTIGLKPFNQSFFQNYTLSINTFPSDMEVKYNGKVLRPGVDYIVDPSCPSVNFSNWVDFIPISALDSFDHYQSKGRFLKSAIIDTFSAKYFTDAAINLKHYTSDPKNQLIIKLSADKLTWSCSQKQGKVPCIILNSSVFDASQKAFFEVHIKSKFLPKYPSRNVVGFIEGSKYKDSFIYVTAHYDHLGQMGKATYFPGANDNASGVSMMLQLAQYFSVNQPKYSMVFIAFSGEEAGLLGSRYYVEHPFTALSDIKFLVNLDLMGNGIDGVMVVNGLANMSEFNALKNLNTQMNYLPDVKLRGKAANSDHYWFAESGVPAFFFYLMGPYPHYHDVNDVASALPLNNYNQAYLLFRDFMLLLQNAKP